MQARTVPLTALTACLAAGTCVAQGLQGPTAPALQAGECQIVTLGSVGHWQGCALRDRDGTLAEVSFGPGGRWEAGECSIARDGRGLAFTHFNTSGTGGTPTLGAESTISVRCPAGAGFPEVAYRLVLDAFDRQRWCAAFQDPAPLCFLCLSIREPLMWYQGGFGVTTRRVDAYPLNPKAPNGLRGNWAPGWSYAPPMGAYSTPVVGLWNPYERGGVFAGYDFTAARLTDKSENLVASAYCQGLGGHRECIALVHPYQRNFTELTFPVAGSVAQGHFDLVYWSDLGPEGEPQERLLHRTYQRFGDLLPTVPAMSDLDWVLDEGIQRVGGTGLLWDYRGETGGPVDSYLKPGTTWIGNWDVADGVRAAWGRQDAVAVGQLKQDLKRLLPLAKRFEDHGLDCVAWECPVAGSFKEELGGAAATTVRHNSTFEIGAALVLLYQREKDASLLPYIDGVYNWARRYLGTRGNIFDLPAATLPLIATAAGEQFLLEYRLAFRGDPQRGERAERALEMARAAVYKDARFYLADPDPYGWVDPTFMMQANDGRWWVGKVSWAELGLCLKSMLVVYTETGDPVLEYLLRGALERWWLGYRKFGDIDEENIQVFPEGEPEGNRTAGMMGQGLINGFRRYARPTDGAACRVVVGERAAMAFCAGTTAVNVADYRFHPPAGLRFRLINTAGRPVDVIVTAPKRRIAGQPMLVNGKRLTDARYREYPQTGGEDILVRGLNDGDVVQIGQVGPGQAEVLPQPRYRSRPTGALTRHGGFACMNLYPFCDLALDQRWREGDWFRLIPGPCSPCGVTFDLVDAALNAGRGAMDCRQPRRIPVRAAGDALYFLCGLTNAEREEMLAGGRSELGQVDVAYADGSSQVAKLTLGIDGCPLNGLPIKRFRADMSVVRARAARIDHVTVNGPRLLAMTVASGPGAAALAEELRQRNDRQVQADAASLAAQQQCQTLVTRWRAELRDRLGGRMPWLALLPPFDGGTIRRVRAACRELGALAVPISRERLLEAGVDPAVFPVAAYTASETYVTDPQDPDRARQRYLDYLRKGGFLVSACLAAPFAFPQKLNDTGQWVADTDAVFRAPRLHLFGEDLELCVAHPAKTWADCVPFERPEKPDELELRLNLNQQVVASPPRAIAWTDRGNLDERYRPISGAALAEGDRFTPIYSLYDQAGRDYGAAVALIEHGCRQFAGAKALYLWNGLVDSDRPQAGQLLAEALRYSVLDAKWPEAQPKLAEFWEGFQDDLSQWQVVVGSKAELRDGALLLGDNTEVLSRPGGFSDFTLSLGVRKEGDRFAEVFFRARDINNGYMFGLRAGGGQVALFRREAGRWTELGNCFFPHTPETQYEVTIRAVGPLIECFVDGRRYLKVEDATYQTGAIGLGGWENDVLFDDVVVDAVPTA